MTQLVMPAPLDSRLFHSVQKVAAYNEAVSAYLHQQASLEYDYSKSKRNKNKSRRQRYTDDEQN